jgi:hypothetical protein
MARALTAVGRRPRAARRGLGLASTSRATRTTSRSTTCSRRTSRGEVARAGQGRDVDLAQVAPFDWDRVLIVEPGTPRRRSRERLGYEWTGTLGFETGEKLILLDATGRSRASSTTGATGASRGSTRRSQELPRERGRLPGARPGDHPEGVSGPLGRLDLSLDLPRRRPSSA